MPNSVFIPPAAELVAQIKSGDNIFIHGGAATPNTLIAMLLARAQQLKNVTFYHLHSEGRIDYAGPEYKNSFRVKNLFVGANMRPLIDFDRVDYIPCFLSEIPHLFRQKKIPLDWAFIQTSSVDHNGIVSLGTSVDVAKAAVESATKVIAEINSQMPRTFGDGLISVQEIDGAILTDRPIFQAYTHPLSKEELEIGKYVAELVEDGSCLQMGIGSIPNAVLGQLRHHKNLGIHSEMCSDGIIELIESGVVNNSQKKTHPGRSVCSFLIGTQKLYNHVNNNPSFFLLEAGFVNNPTVIAMNSKVVAINSAVEVDLTGQVCADSIGSKIISGVGGQMDFIRGASLSENGKPIIAMSTRTKKGVSRIVTQLKAGAGVVTTRAHIHSVVTEYGAADLYGKSIGERARALISIAHPADREQLEKDWRQLC
ncbi:MAG: acetyl-CoA hydrolase/transferase family protein [Pseudobdellovibrionaceae bacterium]